MRGAAVNSPSNVSVAEAVAVYQVVGETAARIFHNAVTGSRGQGHRKFQSELGKIDPSVVPATGLALPASPLKRIVLLTFPNSGSTATLKLSACITRSPMCSQYCNDDNDAMEASGSAPTCALLPDASGTCSCQQGASPSPCGRGAILLNKSNLLGPDRVFIPRITRLVKSHGIEYGFGSNGAETTKLAPWLEYALGPCDGTSISGVLRMVRNPFDNVGARFRYGFHLGRAPEKLPPPNFDRFARTDICVLLRWYHRVAAVAQSCSTSVLTYEEMIQQPESRVRLLNKILASDSAAQPSPALLAKCAGWVLRKSSATIPNSRGVVLPEYIVKGWYTADLVRYMAVAVMRYLRESDRFTSDKLVNCLDWK